jgi:hypothetical protein
MKKLYAPALLALFLTASCDMILKDKEDSRNEIKPSDKVVVGNDKDPNGCVTSAGYRWSQLRKDCIRAFEEGYRLNLIDDLEEDGADQSAFALFDEGGEKAELFLPGQTGSVMLTKEGGSRNLYTNGKWEMQQGKGYTLKHNGRLMYVGAPTIEKMVTGSDKEE